MTMQRMSVLLFCLLMLAPLPFLPEFGGANSSTRLMLSAAIMDDHTTRIDRHAALTGDKAEQGGHFYSDKAPGMALLALPVYGLGQRICPQNRQMLFRFDLLPTELPFCTALHYRVIVWLTGGLLMALAGVALFRMCLRLGGSAQSALLAAFSVFLATPLLGWSAQFFGHVGAGAALALGFALATGFARQGTWLGPYLRAICAATVLTLAVSIEYTAAPVALIVGLYALWRLTFLPRAMALRLLALAITAALLAAGPMLVYHHVSFGSPFRVGYSSVIGFEGMQQGFLGLTRPDSVVLGQIIFGLKRGILWLSPLLVMLPWGVWAGLRRANDGPGRVETGLCLGVICYYFLLNASYYYWGGGSSVGPRHTLPAIFFMMLPLCVLWHHATGRARRVVWALFGLSLFFSFASASVTMTTPTGFRFPLLDPILTNFLTGQNTLFQHPAFGGAWPLAYALWLVMTAGLAARLWQGARRLSVSG